MANQLYGSTDQIGDILRRMRQYNALRGTNMPQTTQTALFEGMGKAASQDASRRYYQTLAEQNAARQAEQRDKALKMAQEGQDAQALQGWLGLGYKGLGGEQGIKDLWGKASNWWNGTHEVPAAYNPASASAYDLGNYSANAMADSLNVQPTTARGLLGDYLNPQDYSAFTMGTDNPYGDIISGGIGDVSLGGGAGMDTLAGSDLTGYLDRVGPIGDYGVSGGTVSGGGLATVGGAGGGGLPTIGDYGLGGGDIISGSAGDAVLESGSGVDALGSAGGVFDSVPWGSGGLAAGASVVGDLLSGGNVNIGKAAGAGAGGIGGGMLGAALTGGSPIGAAIGSILGGGGGGFLGDALGGGGSVLCTELHRQGKLDGEVYSLDSLHGLSVDAVTMAGYHSWGIPVARAMGKSRVLTAILAPFIRAWAYHMAAKMMPEKYQPNALGRVLYKLGVPLCRFIGRRVARKMRPQEV